MFTVAFWKAAAERAIKSAAQAIIGAVVLSDTGPTNLFELDAKLAVGVAAGGAVLSVLTSIISAPISGAGPSLAPKAEVDAALAPLLPPDGS